MGNSCTGLNVYANTDVLVSVKSAKQLMADSGTQAGENDARTKLGGPIIFTVSFCRVPFPAC